MTKIAYNNCYGGFSLSPEAIRHYLGKIGAKYEEKIDVGFPSLGPSFFLPSFKDGVCFSDRDIARFDPVLIETIETLGDAANGMCAALAIRDIPAGTKYRIDEYDGNESVVTIDEYDWLIA